MKHYSVAVPIAGVVYVEVDANSDEEAIDLAVEHAFDNIEASGDGLGELEAYRKLHYGNVSCVSLSQAEICERTEIEED